MAQNIINYGESPNDGEGDSLRTAFIKTDDNFDQIWATGPVGSNVTILNNTIGVVNTNGNLILSPNGIGVIQTNSKLVPRIPNTYDLGSPNLRYRSAYIGTGGLDVSGNIVIAGGLELDGDVVIDGNLTVNGNDTYINMANLVSINVGSNANVNWQFNQTGNLTLPNIANPSINYANGEPYVSTGSGGVTQSDAAPAGPTPSTLWWDEVSGRLYVYYTDADGSQWVDASPAATGSTYGNANVAAYLTTYTGNLAAGNLNVSSGSDSWTMSGQFLTGPGGAYWHSHPEQSSDDFVSAPGSDIRIQSIDADSVVESQISLTGIDIELIVVNGVTKTWRFNESGTSEIPGDIVPILPLGATANVGNITNPWDNAYISGNIESGNVSATGNITANYFIGNGSLLTGLASSYGNADVAANLAAFGSNPISTTGSITSSSLSAINLVINSITSDDSSFVNISDGVNVNGEILATGNITASNIGITGGSLTWANASIVQTSALDVSITGDGQVTVRSQDGTYQWTFDSNGNLTLPGATAGETIATSGGYITVGNLLIGQGGALFNSNNDSWALYGNRSDAGTSIFIPSNADAGNGTPLFLENQISNVEIRSGSSTWNFDSTGNLNLPAGGTILESTYLGAGSIRLRPNGGSATQYLEIAPTAVDGDHVHLMAGSGNTELFLGDDNQYVKLANTGNIVVNTNDNAGNSAQWTFNNFGTLSLPGGSQIRPLGANLDIFAGTGSYVNLITSDESSSMGVDNGGGYIVTAGGTWGFGTTGNLTAPGNVSAVGNITGGNLSVTGNVTGNTAGFAIGYRDIPQVSFTGNATIATTDAGKHYYSTLSTGNVLTIANNASQGFQVGAAITVVNQGTGTITIAQGSGVTLYLAGNATSGNRSVSTFGMATIIKVATDTWFINGTGVS